MAIQLSTTVRNARLDAIETAVGTSAVLKIRTGAAPANVGTADSGTVLATVNLPSDWMAAASGGSKSLSGTWQDAAADAAGTAAHCCCGGVFVKQRGRQGGPQGRTGESLLRRGGAWGDGSRCEPEGSHR